MANPEHLDILRQGVEVWDRWKKEHPDVRPDLNDADLRHADFSNADLRRTDLRHADLRHADLSNADLTLANLSSAHLGEADLGEADLTAAQLINANLSIANLRATQLINTDLSGVNLYAAHLYGANFINANLSSADLSYAKMGWTIFGDLDLRTIKGLETIGHEGPSTIGTDTILRSEGDIPESFLRGAGLDDTFISYVLSLARKPIQYYTCFISYSSRDQAFAERLYADLQSKNVRCWYAPEDMNIGDKIRPRIDESIRLYDKLLVILSEDSLASNWVAYEVEKALNKEPEGTPNVLFPIRLDNTILTCETDWAKDIRQSRHIGDFEHWKDHDAYQRAFQRLLRDLKAQS